MTAAFTESVVEEAALAWLAALGYSVLHGPDISPVGDTLTPALSQREREKYSDVVLEGRLRQALARLNRDLPPEALEDAYRKLTRPDAPTLVKISRELVETVRRNVTIDWTVRENVRAQLRVIVKRILRKYGYPPDKREKATRTVLEQAEVLSAEWAVA